MENLSRPPRVRPCSRFNSAAKTPDIREEPGFDFDMEERGFDGREPGTMTPAMTIQDLFAFQRRRKRKPTMSRLGDGLS